MPGLAGYQPLSPCSTRDPVSKKKAESDRSGPPDVVHWPPLAWHGMPRHTISKYLKRFIFNLWVLTGPWPSGNCLTHRTPWVLYPSRKRRKTGKREGRERKTPS